jgi:hypothetical protein
MNIKFNWIPEPKPNIKINIEDEVSDFIKDHNIKPCHHDAIIVSPGISGPLDFNLRGSGKCECGKTLIEFEGSELTISKFTAYKIDQ